MTGQEALEQLFTRIEKASGGGCEIKALDLKL